MLYIMSCYILCHVIHTVMLYIMSCYILCNVIYYVMLYIMSCYISCQKKVKKSLILAQLPLEYTSELPCVAFFFDCIMVIPASWADLFTPESASVPAASGSINKHAYKRLDPTTYPSVLGRDCHVIKLTYMLNLTRAD